MPFITVSAGAPSADVEPGVYEATLIDVQEDTITTNDRGDVDVYRWRWALDLGDDNGVEVESLTSVNTSPKSKLFGYLVALLGADKVGVGKDFEQTDLIGREALITIIKNADGWPKVEQVTGKPKVGSRPA